MNRINAYDFIGQVVFARWNDGYYYPAVVDSIGDYDAKVSYLDGDVGAVKTQHIVELREALSTFDLQGNWEERGIFFRGKISGDDPLVMNYNDGDVEQIEMKQLRGIRPGEPIIWKRVVGLALAGIAAGVGIYLIARR